MAASAERDHNPRKVIKEWAEPIGAIIAALAIVVPVVRHWTASTTSIAQPTTTTLTSPVVQSPGAFTSQAATTLESSSGCVDQMGQTIPCDQPSAFVAINATDCSIAGVSEYLLPGTDWSNLDLTVRHLANSCIVQPGPLSKAAGATIADIAEVSDIRAFSRLNLCRTSSDSRGQDVSCSHQHMVEYVGPWIQIGAARPTANTCIDPVASYTNRSDAGADPELEPLVFFNSKGLYRCGVGSTVALNGSVLHVADGDLPRA